VLQTELTHTGQPSANLVDVFANQTLQTIGQLLIQHDARSLSFLFQANARAGDFDSTDAAHLGNTDVLLS
jgi:hypothetical protein